MFHPNLASRKDISIVTETIYKTLQENGIKVNININTPVSEVKILLKRSSSEKVGILGIISMASWKETFSER